MAMTRRKWLTTMGSGTLVAGVGAIAARGFGALGSGTAHHFQPVPATGTGSPRAVLQQKHLLNLPLVTQDGKAVKFYDDLVKDKKVVLTFMNTDPAALASSKKVSKNLSELQKFFGSRMGKDLHFYTITANPQRDTPAVLKNWGVPVQQRLGLDLPDRQRGQRRQAPAQPRLRGRVRHGPDRPELLGRRAPLRHRAGDALGALPVAGGPASDRSRDAAGLRDRPRGSQPTAGLELLEARRRAVLAEVVTQPAPRK
jgi:hypothetical protein